MLNMFWKSSYFPSAYAILCTTNYVFTLCTYRPIF